MADSCDHPPGRTIAPFPGACRGAFPGPAIPSQVRAPACRRTLSGGPGEPARGQDDGEAHPRRQAWPHHSPHIRKGLASTWRGLRGFSFVWTANPLWSTPTCGNVCDHAASPHNLSWTSAFWTLLQMTLSAPQVGACLASADTKDKPAARPGLGMRTRQKEGRAAGIPWVPTSQNRAPCPVGDRHRSPRRLSLGRDPSTLSPGAARCFRSCPIPSSPPVLSFFLAQISQKTPNDTDDGPPFPASQAGPTPDVSAPGDLQPGLLRDR